MALLFFEGFETISNTTGAGTNAALIAYWESLGGLGNLTASEGARLAVAQDAVHTAMKWGNNTGADSNYMKIPLPTVIPITTGTITIGMRVRLSNLSNSSFLCRVYDNDDSLVFNLIHNGGQTISISRAGTVIGTSGNIVTVGNWYYFEVKYTPAASPNGSYEVRVDGINVLSATGVNTLDGSVGNMAYVHFGAPFGGAPDANQAYIDDIYICDHTTAFNNTFLGAQVVRGVMPDAEGAVNDWTPSTGTNNSALVDELPLSTTDYVESSTTGHDDLYSFASIGAVAVKGVRLHSMIGLSDVSTTRSYHLQAVSNSVTADSPVYTVSSVDTTRPNGNFHVFQLDPNTSALWGVGAINAAEFGLELD